MSEDKRIRLLFKGQRGEQAILDGIREGRESAFNALYHLYSPRIFRLAATMLKDDFVAEHVLQETFMRVFRKIHKFRGDSGLGTWVYRIAVNLCLNELKRRKRKDDQTLSLDDMVMEPAEPDAPRGDDELARREVMRQIEAIIGDMPPKKRFTFTLYYVEEMTVDEIAAVMDEGRGTVLKRMQRLREELVERLERCGVSSEAWRRALGKRG